eukprot:6249321-Amphidinium_carterae.1
MSVVTKDERHMDGWPEESVIDISVGSWDEVVSVFTDGSAASPKDYVLRRATWSVVGLSLQGECIAKLAGKV